MHPPVDCPPIFAGLTLLTASDLDELTLAWLPATDDDTPASNILYHVHLSEVPELEPSAGNLATSVVGQTDVVLTGLSSATEYHVLVLAEDALGLVSIERDVRTVSTPSFETLMSETTPLELAEDLLLGIPTIVEPTRLVFAKAPGSIAPSVGAILVGPLGGQAGYLRQVEAVSATATEWHVTTAPGTMGDAVDQIDLGTSAVLLDVGAASGATTSGIQWDGSRRSQVAWRNLLSLEQVDHAVDRDGLVLQPGSGPGRHHLEQRSVELGTDLVVDLAVTFEPEVVSRAKWGLFGVDEAELIASGTLALRASAQFAFDFAGSYSPESVTLFTRSWRSIYVAPGGIPVFQEITLEVDAEVSASATAAVQAYAEASAGVTAGVGLTYDSTDGWQPVSQLGLERSLSTSLSIQGSAEAEIRLIPRVSVEFYGVLTGTLSVEPHLNGDLAVDDAVHLLCFPAEMTRFDFTLGLECHAGVDFSPFRDTYTLWEGQVCDASWPLFGLTEFADPAVTTSGSAPTRLTAHLQDGVDNPVDPASVVWDVSPAATATVVPDGADPLAASLCCTTSDTYTVTVAGNGRLGRLGRRCQQTTVGCSAGACDPVASFTASVSGLTVDFEDASTEGSSPIDSWAWSFGDGATSTEQNPTHTYASNGVYSVGLTIEDAVGSVDSTSQDVTIAVTESAVVTEIADATGDGAGNPLDWADSIAVDSDGNVFVAGVASRNVLKVAPGGQVTEVIDETGDGDFRTLVSPSGIAVDSSGNLYVPGKFKNYVFKVTPGGQITSILGPAGILGQKLDAASSAVVDGSDNVFVAGEDSNNVFRVTPGGAISVVIDSTGDGSAPLLGPRAMTVDSSGNLYVAGNVSHNVFKVTPSGVVTEIIDTYTNGTGPRLLQPLGLAVDSVGNVYVTGASTQNLFKITPGGTITEIADSSGDGIGGAMRTPKTVVHWMGDVFVAGLNSSNVLRITPSGLITEVVDMTGDGAGNPLESASGLAVDSSGTLYVSGVTSDNLFEVRFD